MAEEKPRYQLLQQGNRWIILRKGNTITAILRTKNKYGTRTQRHEGVAMCHTELDTFEEQFGTDLAKTRALLNYENDFITALRAELKIYDEILAERNAIEQKLKARLASRARLHKRLRELVPPKEKE